MVVQYSEPNIRYIRYYMNYTSWLYMISVNYTTSLSATVLSCTIPFDWYSILFMDDTS